MTSQRLKSTDLAGIQYVGLDGVTAPCIRAITRLINSGAVFEKAFLLSCEQDHAFIFHGEYEDFIAVKTGFSSGYSGEGPRGLATALMLLHRHKIDVEEYQVKHDLMHRLEHSSLLQSDIEQLIQAKPVRPQRWYDYVYDQGLQLERHDGRLVRYYPSCLPFAIIDERIMDLAIQFPDNEDASILGAYRRLEDLLRKRTGLTGEGTKLFSRAFVIENAPLSWDVPDEAESKGRGNLFNAVYMAFRNARAHRELEQVTDSSLREFLLINELFRLEADSLTEIELQKKKAEEASLNESTAFIRKSDSNG